jgi:hypothetical protein
MKVIVPGGHYSYYAAEKKLYPSYEYYNVGVEQVESIRNLSKDMLFYDASNPQYPITVENGCITHTYPSAGADGDKIQIVLKTPILSVDDNTYQPLLDSNAAYLLDSNGKIIEVPV